MHGVVARAHLYEEGDGIKNCKILPCEKREVSIALLAARARLEPLCNTASRRPVNFSPARKASETLPRGESCCNARAGKGQSTIDSPPDTPKGTASIVGSRRQSIRGIVSPCARSLARSLALTLREKKELKRRSAPFSFLSLL